jgi:putative chitinase
MRLARWIRKTMIEISEQLLVAAAPFPGISGRAARYAKHLHEAAIEFEISLRPRRVAAWLANVLHESGALRYVREIADGHAYEGRLDLGNTQPGDGVRFPGRGLGQITGRANYRACGRALGVDLEHEPHLLERPDLACRSAAWFWATRPQQLNALADTDRFGAITRAYNGGYNGLDDRLAYWLRLRFALTI